MNIIILPEQIIDGTQPGPQKEKAVFISNGKIKSIQHVTDLRPNETQNAEIIELPGYSLLPGLIDVHVHLDGWASNDRTDFVYMRESTKALNAAYFAGKMLKAGFTTVRDAGSTVAGALNAIQAGKFLGPRIYYSHKGIYQTNGQGDRSHLPIEWVKENETCVLVDGDVECRKAVRLMLREGVDFIKIATSGGYLSSEPHFTLEEVKALCDEAHRMEKRVAAHTIGEVGIHTALMGGTDSIEHGGFLSKELAEMMAEKGVQLVPTFAIRVRSIEKKDDIPLTSKQVEDRIKGFEGTRLSVQNAMESGVDIALGTDFGGQPILGPDELALEFKYLVEAGLSNYESILAGTIRAAEVIGVEDQVGTVEEGKLADLVAIKGNPIEDISLLQDVKFVMKGGEIIKRPE